LPKVGQNGTDICLKLKVKLGKVWDIRWSKLLSYKMVRTFNNFKASVTFAMKKSEALLILVEKL
jgi:hypothetical protein